MAHTSVQGATYGSERMVMLGQELVLTPGLLRDKRLDYVALGHIHQHQSLNGTDHPPIVYPGSIERIDFGEAREAKGFVLAEVQQGPDALGVCEAGDSSFYGFTGGTRGRREFYG